MMYMTTEYGWVLENISQLSQPLIVAALLALAVYWRKAGQVGKEALDRATSLGQTLEGLNHTVEQLNTTLSEIHEKLIHTDHRLQDLEDEMERQRRRSHDHANHLQVHEVQISVLKTKQP